MHHQINLSPVTQFIQLLRAAELGQQKEVKLSIQQARLLNLALTEMLDKINKDFETMLNEFKKSSDTEVISVSMDGGEFGDSK